MPINLRTIAGVISSRWREPAVCEACGNPFSCGAMVTGCWCSEIKLSDEVRAELRTRYHTCLCRDCLERIATSAENNAG